VPYKAGYTEHLTLDQTIQPGKAEHFVIQVGSDASASFDFALRFRDSNGTNYPGAQIHLNLFVPRDFRPEEINPLDAISMK
jgi:hypothetical protein